MGTGKRRSRKVRVHCEKSEKDIKVGAKELQATVKQRNYCATPYSTSRVAPAIALFGRPIKTKLPEVTYADADIRQCDQAVKAKMKEYADNKQYVKPLPIKEVDIVRVKRDETKRKGNTPYNLVPHTVVETKGSMVTAENVEGVPITRNYSLFKSVPDFKTSCEEQKNSTDDGPQ